MKMKTKKPIYRELAEFLGVGEQTIKQANPKKRELMILGLWMKKEDKANEEEEEKKGQGGLF